MSTVTRDYLNHALTVVTGAVLLFSFGLAAQRFAQSMVFAAQRPGFGLTYTGGLVAWLATHPEFLYHAIDQPPHVPTIYTPFVPLVVGGAASLTGLPVPQLQRALGLGAALGTGALLGLTVSRVSGRRLPGVIAGGLYVMSPAVTRSTVLSRVDHVGVLFAIAAVYVVVTREGRGRFFAAAVLSVLAVLAKQSLVVIPAAILVAFIVDGDDRQARTFATDGLIVGGIALLPLLAVYGWAFVRQTVLLNAANPILLGRLLEQAGWAAFVHLPLFVVGGVLSWQYANDAEWLPTVAPLLVIFGGAAALATLGKLGSWIGYAYPLIAGTCLVVGFAAAEFLPEAVTRRPLPDGTLIIAGVVAAQLMLFGAWAPSTVTDPGNQQAVAEMIDDANGPVLSEDASLLVATDQAEAYEPLMMKPLASGGEWDQTQLTERISSQEFAYIVTWMNVEAAEPHAGRWTFEQKQAIGAAYEQVEKRGQYHVYRPAEEVSA